jgi:hypothetical protein
MKTFEQNRAECLSSRIERLKEQVRNFERRETVYVWLSLTGWAGVVALAAEKFV